MNCNCVKRTETNLAAAPFIVEKAGTGITVECMATGFQMTDDMDLISTINVPFRIRGTGKGFSSANGKTMPFVASFCPFCGRTAGAGKYTVGEYDGLVATTPAGAA
jgi:hypothetical protein